MSSGEADGLSAVTVNNSKRIYVGKVHRIQGPFGDILVVGRLQRDAIELIEKPKRLFKPDGLVDAHGINNSGLLAGDWVAFELSKNTRRSAIENKAMNLRRLTRYADLSNHSLARVRILLTKEGWRGARHPGYWVIRASPDQYLFVRLEQRKDGALQISSDATHDIKWQQFRELPIAQLSFDGAKEQFYLGKLDNISNSFDWSDDIDHIQRVVRSLTRAKDPRWVQVIALLDEHRNLVTDHSLDIGVDHASALEMLRSGELAARLRSDQALMKSYIDAAIQEPQVAAAVEHWAQQAHTEAAFRRNQELEQEILAQREQRLAELALDAQEIRRVEMSKVKQEADAQLRTLDAECAEKIAACEAEILEKRATWRQDATKQAKALAAIQDEMVMAIAAREKVQAEELECKTRLENLGLEIDRLLAVSQELEKSSNAQAMLPASATPAIGLQFAAGRLAIPTKIAKSIAETPLLSDLGKKRMIELTVLMLAGELPILCGEDATGFLRVAGHLLCPGRTVSIEADPAIISIEDMWYRPGSGVETVLPAAANAVANGGSVLVSIRSLERSGARFWFPALQSALREGQLPRGLLVAATIGDVKHDEFAALPSNLHLINTAGLLADHAYLAAPFSFTIQPHAGDVLDPVPVSWELGMGMQLLNRIGFKPTLELGLTIMRIFSEARLFSDDDDAAEAMTRNIISALDERNNFHKV